MLAERFVSLLKERKLKVSTAESVTGGMIVSSIVDIAGSSKVLGEAYVAYSLESKTKVLGINPALFLSHDIVSERIALEMAKGLKRKTSVDVVIATTGVAGPDGGTKLIPVGTVCIAIGYKELFHTQTLHLQGTRNEIRKAAVEAAFETSIQLIQGE